MKIIQKTDEKLIFEEEMDVSLANAIRRSVLEIPVLAIDEVMFEKNDSVLYDEVIALRLGLVPLKNDLDLTLQEDCTCGEKGCGKCTIQLKMSEKGPKIVYSGDLKGKVDVVYDKMPITQLTEEQELEFAAIAKLGKGTEHAKFSPGLAYYRNNAEIEIDKECVECGKCAEVCPKNVLKLENGKLKIKDIENCDMCEMCVETCKKNGSGSIKITPGKNIIFTIESWGQMKAKDILIEAVKALKSNLKEIK